MQGPESGLINRRQDSSIDIASLPSWLLGRLNLRREADLGWLCRHSPHVVAPLALVVDDADNDVLPLGVLYPDNQHGTLATALRLPL